MPPLRIDDLIEDLKDGTRLLALLEVLSGEKLVIKKREKRVRAVRISKLIAAASGGAAKPELSKLSRVVSFSPWRGAAI